MRPFTEPHQNNLHINARVIRNAFNMHMNAMYAPSLWRRV